MGDLASVPEAIYGAGTATLFIDRVFRQHGSPVAIISDRDTRFTGQFWKSIVKLLGTRFDMSTADLPQIDGQTERVNRVIGDILRSICANTARSLSSMLPVVEFALSNSDHASTGYTPTWWGEMADRLADVSPDTAKKQVSEYLATRLNVLRHAWDAMAESQEQRKEQADANSRGCIESYEAGDQVLLSTKNLPTNVVSAVFETKLRPRFIGTFTVMAKKGLAYTLNLPRKLRTHSGFYVGLLKPYRDPSHVDFGALAPRHLALPQAAASEQGCQDEAQPGSEHAPTPEGESVPRQAYDGSNPKSREDTSLREPDSSGHPPIQRPPPALLDKQGNLHFHVEKVLARRRRHGQNQYLTKWRGYPESENSWEYEIPLRQDFPYAMDVFEHHRQAHPATKGASCQ
ncbi:unnamed protein product [Albugo candida]|nr:unnamed protein product [Albugo candida]|eukprot:CCI50318.1 unnamed protein product [Albugo candida]